MNNAGNCIIGAMSLPVRFDSLPQQRLLDRLIVVCYTGNNLGEEIQKAYEKVEKAEVAVFDPNNRAAMIWNSPEQKEYEQAKDDFVKTVNSSEYYDLFNLYADEMNRWSYN